MVRTCLDAAQAAAADGVEIEVIDLRTLSPLDVDTRLRVGRADRPAGRRARGAGVPRASARELAARVTERCFYSLQAPVLRVGGYHAPYPPSRLEEHYLPDLDRVLDAVDRSLAI